MKNFLDFIREQGVIGLTVGFILGGSVSKVVTSLVNDLINPILGLMLGRAGDLKNYYLAFDGIKIMWGNFLSVTMDFMLISAVVYFLVKGLKLDRLDKKKA